ncbi:MAG: adenylyl-sulfate kinase [Bacteroidales bacterium]
MVFIQFTGLSGAGKTTLTILVRNELLKSGYKVEMIDGDEYRKNLCSDLGFSKEDRMRNIRRLGFVGKILLRNEIIVLLSAINPYEEIRKEIKNMAPDIFTVWINCSLEMLIQRDTKGMYHRAMLPDGHPDKIYNLTGVNDPFEIPENPDLIVNTHLETIEESKEKILQFIFNHLKK